MGVVAATIDQLSSTHCCGMVYFLIRNTKRGFSYKVRIAFISPNVLDRAWQFELSQLRGDEAC